MLPSFFASSIWCSVSMSDEVGLGWLFLSKNPEELVEDSEEQRSQGWANPVEPSHY